MRFLGYVIVASAIVTGCTVPQEAEMGASPDRREGFSGYGVENVRALEGPLSDLMIPDDSPKGLTDPSIHLSGEGSYTTNHRNLSMRHEGQNHQGARILSNRPGVLRDKYQHSQNPHVKKQSNQLNDYQATSHLTRKLEASIEALENVRDAHVMSDGERIVIGLESSEQDRVRLIRAVEQEVEKITDLQQVTITTDRKIINRMNAVEHHVGLGKPFESISGAAGDLADLFDDAAHGRR